MITQHYFDPSDYDYIPSIHTLHKEYPEYAVEELARMRDIIHIELVHSGEKIWTGYAKEDSIPPTAKYMVMLKLILKRADALTKAPFSSDRLHEWLMSLEKYLVKHEFSIKDRMNIYITVMMYMSHKSPDPQLIISTFECFGIKNGEEQCHAEHETTQQNTHEELHQVSHEVSQKHKQQDILAKV